TGGGEPAAHHEDTKAQPHERKTFVDRRYRSRRCAADTASGFLTSRSCSEKENAPVASSNPEPTHMKALQFHMSVPKIALARAVGLFTRDVYTSAWGAVQLDDIPDAQVRGDRWVVVRPALTGICGSDQKQVQLKGHFDNPISGIISFPHVLGHESAGIVAEAGRAVPPVKPGERIAINPRPPSRPPRITPPWR